MSYYSYDDIASRDNAKKSNNTSGISRKRTREYVRDMRQLAQILHDDVFDGDMQTSRTIAHRLCASGFVSDFELSRAGRICKTNLECEYWKTLAELLRVKLGERWDIQSACAAYRERFSLQ